MFTAIRRAFSSYPSQDGEFTLAAKGEVFESMMGWGAYAVTTKVNVTLRVVDGDALWANRKIMGIPMKRYVTSHLNDALTKMVRNGTDLKKLSYSELQAQLVVAKGDFFAGMGLRIIGARTA